MLSCGARRRHLSSGDARIRVLFALGRQDRARQPGIHEVKYDGYRLRLERDGDGVRLITRGGYNWADRYIGQVDRNTGSR